MKSPATASARHSTSTALPRLSFLALIIAGISAAPALATMGALQPSNRNAIDVIVLNEPKGYGLQQVITSVQLQAQLPFPFHRDDRTQGVPVMGP